MTPTHYALLSASALALTLSAWGALRLERALEGWRLRRRFRRARRGQAQARRFLERRGFVVLAEEHPLQGEVEVDGLRHTFEVRVDYLVQRRGRTFVVEVKTGQKAPDPLVGATRRQLREYAGLLPLDGVYLLDMESRQLSQVRFLDPPGGRRGAGWPWALALALGFLLGTLCALVLQR